MKYNIFAIIVVFLIFGSAIYLFFEATRTPFFNLYLIFVPFLFFMLIARNNGGEFLGAAIKTKNFTSSSGVIGAVVGIPQHHPGGYVTYKVNVYKRYVKDDKIIAKLGFFESLRQISCYFVDSTPTIEVFNKSSKFHDVPSEYCEAPEGCIRYDGCINSDINIPSESDLIKAKYDNLITKLSEIETIYLKAKQISSTSAQEQNVSMMDAAEKIGSVVENMHLENFRPQIIPGAGTMSSGGNVG